MIRITIAAKIVDTDGDSVPCVTAKFGDKLDLFNLEKGQDLAKVVHEALARGGKRLADDLSEAGGNILSAALERANLPKDSKQAQLPKITSKPKAQKPKAPAKAERTARRKSQ